ncbi:hypothetical protein Mal64_35450 [Pseudobythopirellula maris]|uniref:DUF5666 domain-containing protein n=1 Tax=Pseudobythopirellula maris TaxID=2527991 RepID=A0A5C5ZHM0_9BACT|nr:hypothetical protein [Pseudobythopirellula maris]TWT86716.1 hypothetical protein Mal64_35450 [Pseudobythopirellula maris]
MSMTATRTLCFTLAAIASGAATLSVGCGSATGSSASAPTAATKVDASRYTLAEEPEGAMGVIDARDSVEDGASLVLVGRVGGAANPWVDGRAAFTLLDPSMSVVANGEDSGSSELCLDDCCAVDRQKCTTLVKVVDATGKIVPVDSRELFGLKVSDMVVVKGTAQKDRSGNFVMLASGVYIRN